MTLRTIAERCRHIALLFSWCVASAHAQSIHPLTDIIPGHQVGGVAVDAVGNLYVADFGDIVWKIPPEAQPVVFAQGLYGSSGNAVDHQGNLFQSSYYGDFITKIDRTGRSTLFASTGLAGPVGIAIEKTTGDLYVANCRGNYIARIGGDGVASVFAKSDLFKCPNGIAFDSAGLLYVVDTVAMRVVAMTTEGKVLARFGKPGDGPAEFNYPTHITVAADGSLWIVDSLNFRVQHLDSSGKFLSAFGGVGDRPGEFDKPKGIAIDREGRIMVVEGRFDRVQAYDPRGQLMFSFGSTGGGAGEFFLPAGIALGDDGNIYIADSQNGRIEIFRPNASAMGGR